MNLYGLQRLRNEKTFYLLLLYPLFVILLGLYLQSWVLRAILAFPSSFFPAYCLQRYQELKRQQVNRRLFGHFLQILSAQLAAGTTFVQAFIRATQEVKDVAGQEQDLVQELLRATNAIKGQASVADVLHRCSDRLPCPEAKPIFSLFAAQVSIGGDVSHLAKFSQQMIHDLNETEDAVMAENSRQTMEAFLLALLPYALTALMKWTAQSYYLQAYGSRQGQILLFGAFLLASVASSLTFYFAADGFQRPGKLPAQEERAWILKFSQFRCCQAWARHVLPHFPSSLSLKWRAVFRQWGMYGHQTLDQRQQTMFNHLAFLPTLFFFSLLIGISPACYHPSFWGFGPALSIALCTVWIQEPLRRAKSCKESLILSFPFFCGMTSSLLQSGFVPRKAIEMAIHLLGEEDTVTGRELLMVAQRLKKGESLRPLLSELALNAQVPEIQAALNLINQFSVTGNSQTLTLLGLQAETCWTLAKHQLRRKKEAKSFQILLPMMLNLLAVLFSALAPVLSNLMSFS